MEHSNSTWRRSSQEVVLDFQGRREGLFRRDESYDLTLQLIDSDLKTVHSKDETVEVVPPLTSELGPTLDRVGAADM